MDTDHAVVIPLFGIIPCHECGHRAQWYARPVTLPCRCGVRSKDDLELALEQVRSYQAIAEAQHARAKLALAAEERRALEAKRRMEAGEAERLRRAWEDVVASLARLVHA